MKVCTAAFVGNTRRLIFHILILLSICDFDKMRTYSTLMSAEHCCLRSKGDQTFLEDDVLHHFRCRFAWKRFERRSSYPLR